MLSSMTEEWRDIQGFEGLYQVSNMGRVKNSRGRIMKFYKINSGYYCLKLQKLDGTRLHPLVHRLVIEAFNPCPITDQKMTVNHINHDKTDNRLENLEWLTYQQNNRDAINAGLCEHYYTGRHTLGKKHKSQVSKYHNVGWDKTRGKWTACVREKGVNLERKRFDTEEEAAQHVNYVLEKYGLHDRPRNVIDKS